MLYLCRVCVCANLDIRGGNGLEMAFSIVQQMQTYSGIVRSALDSVLENSLLKAVASERSRRMLDLRRLLLETVSKDDVRCDT